MQGLCKEGFPPINSDVQVFIQPCGSVHRRCKDTRILSVPLGTTLVRSEIVMCMISLTGAGDHTFYTQKFP
jgi:hypothetical protein